MRLKQAERGGKGKEEHKEKSGRMTVELSSPRAPREAWDMECSPNLREGGHVGR